MNPHRILAASLTIASAALFAGCSTASDSDSRPMETTQSAASVSVSTVTETVAASHSATQSEAPKSEASASGEEVGKQASASGVPGAPLAYPGAGGPVPANARPVATSQYIDYLGREVAMFVTPSGNIGCELSPGGADPMLNCGVDSYHQHPVLGYDENGWPKWFVDVREGNSFAKGDVPLYMEGQYGTGTVIAPEVVQYGEVVHNGPLVCAVAETGVTCWDANTGHGAWLAREGATFF